MDTWVFWFLLLQSVVQYPRPVGDALDEVTRLRMEARAQLQEEEKIRLEREVEQLTLKQGVCAWGELLCSALQHWQLCAVAGLLLLLLALWYMWRKRSLRREECEQDNGAANEEEARDVCANEEDVGNEEEEDDVNGGDNNNDDGNAQEVESVASNEEVDVENEAGNEEYNTGRMLMKRIEWPVQDLQRGCEWTNALMKDFTNYFQRVLSKSFYPMLHPAIGVGSAFEGWSPREEDVVYQVLVPMTPPQRHSFHLELDTAEEPHVRNFHIRVQQECTCSREQQGENMPCFLHQPKEELRRNDDLSLLHTLCTSSYLDVEKTARWFYQLVRAIWPALPQSHHWRLVLLPSRRSCQFEVSNGPESYQIELLFGVQQGCSDIFVSSQPREAYTPSTIWPETYAVAEMKFFQHIARQAPPDSLHLKCLQFFAHLQLGLGFSTYTMKTIIMHLLRTIPMSEWRMRHFVRRLMDICESLRTCVHVRYLKHFILGNRYLPEGIHLPQDVLMAGTCNLFHHLVMDPVAHSQAITMCVDLQRCFKLILKHKQ